MSRNKQQCNKRKHKGKLYIPHTVEDARKSLSQPIPAGWDNAPLIKTKKKHFKVDEIAKLSRAIYEYMTEKDLTKPGRSWQDFILLSTLKEVYKQSAIRELMSTQGESARMAELKVIYENLPPEIVASDDEIEQIITSLRNQKPKYEDITYDEIVAEIAKLRGTQVKKTSLNKRDLLVQIEKVVDSVIKKHERNKWLIFIEGIIIGLISSGLFELLKQALASLVSRAPYTEAQIYEVECDVLRTMDKWKQVVRKADPSVDEKDAEVILLFTLHALSVLSVLGSSVPWNPLFDVSISRR